jgi:mono/diheme cytochrome c family protein
MPAFAWNLSDENVADVLTYIRNSWGNAAAPISAEQVGEQREALQGE